MLERLKKLIELKEKKKLQLKNSVGGGHMASWGSPDPMTGIRMTKRMINMMKISEF